MVSGSEHKGIEPQTSDTARAGGGLARAVIMSAMLGVVLLATLPTLVGYPPPSSIAEPSLPALLGLVSGM